MDQIYLSSSLKKQIQNEFMNAKPWNHHFFGKIMETDNCFSQHFLDLVFHELQKIYGIENISAPHILRSEAEKVIPPAEDPADHVLRKIFRPDVTSFMDTGMLVLTDIQNSWKNADDGRWRYYGNGSSHWNFLEKEPWKDADQKHALMIVITTFDFCRNGRHINIVERKSRWKSKHLPEEQIETIYLSSRGRENDIEAELREFLEYLETGIIRNQSRAAERYQEHMEKLKKDKAWEEKYMTMSYEERMRIGSYEMGIDEGKDKGRSEERNSIARNLISMNIPERGISEATGLSIPEIRKLMK